MCYNGHVLLDSFNAYLVLFDVPLQSFSFKKQLNTVINFYHTEQK